MFCTSNFIARINYFYLHMYTYIHTNNKYERRCGGKSTKQNDEVMKQVKKHYKDKLRVEYHSAHAKKIVVCQLKNFLQQVMENYTQLCSSIVT